MNERQRFIEHAEEIDAMYREKQRFAQVLSKAPVPDRQRNLDNFWMVWSAVAAACLLAFLAVCMWTVEPPSDADIYCANVRDGVWPDYLQLKDTGCPANPAASSSR